MSNKYEIKLRHMDDAIITMEASSEQDAKNKIRKFVEKSIRKGSDADSVTCKIKIDQIKKIQE